MRATPAVNKRRRDAMKPLRAWLAVAYTMIYARAFCPQMRPPARQTRPVARHDARQTTRLHAAPESMESTTAPGDVEAFRRALMRRLAGETLVLADEDAPEDERCGPLREAVRALRVRQREARGGLRGL